MRLSIPPLLPPYSLLVLVLAYAFGSLWLGLARLDDITRMAASTTKSGATLDNLQALREALNDIEAAGPAYGPGSIDALAAGLEHGRERVPVLLSALRDKMRDDASELALLEEIVPMIAERTTLAASNIERRRSASDPSSDVAIDPSARAAPERMLAIIASLRSHELEELDKGRATRLRTIDAARRDLYMMAGVTMLLVGALFLTLRRLRSFIVVIPNHGDKVALAMAADDATKDAGVGTLLRDALLRLQFAAADSRADMDPDGHLRSLREAVERALEAHAAAYGDDRLHARKSLAEALAILVQAYSRADGLAIKAQLDQRARTQDPQTAFLIFRSAEWALEAIALRKRAGDVALELTASEDRIFLRVHTLIDNPRLAVTLTRKESEEANALRQGAIAAGGTFSIGEGPTGLSLMLTAPTASGAN